MLQFEELEEIAKKIYAESGIGVRFAEGLSVLAIDGFYGDYEEAVQVVNVLKAEGYKEFALADSSSGLMDELFAFAQAGCKILGPVKLNQVREYSNGTKRSNKIKAIALAIK